MDIDKLADKDDDSSMPEINSMISPKIETQQQPEAEFSMTTSTLNRRPKKGRTSPNLKDQPIK